MNILNRLEFTDGIIVYYFNDDVDNHINANNPAVFNLSYDKYVVKKSNWTYQQWLSMIKKPEVK